MDLIFVFIFSYLLVLLVMGYLLPLSRERRKARVLAWLLAIGTVFFSTVISSGQAPLMRMLIIVVLLLASMKILVTVETYSRKNGLTPIQWTAFCVGWFGMRPILFEQLPGPSLSYIHFFWKGFSRIFIGTFLLDLSLILDQRFELGRVFIPQLLLLVGLSLILHFGILNLSTAMWRVFGINVYELFQSPYKSRSLKEFWGKRWNIAFSEMTALIAYRPLKRAIGMENALTVSFLLSGLLHEIAISLPVMGGFGLPMIYFGIHAFAMHLEAHSTIVKKIIQQKRLSHVWVMSLLILPMPLLFHQEFIQHVLMPLRTLILEAIGMI